MHGRYEPIPIKPCTVIGRGHSGPGYSKQRWGDGREGQRRGTIVEIEGEVTTIDWSDGERNRYRHHQPERLVDLIKNSGSEVVLRSGILAVRHIDIDWEGREHRSHFLMSVAPDTGAPFGPCSS